MNHFRICAAIIAGCLAGTTAFAEVERLQPDFTFKRTTVPSGGTGSRINVQIDPSAPRLDPVLADPKPELAAISGVGAIRPPVSSLAWFWTTVPASIQDQGPARVQMAIARVNSPPDGKRVPAPRLQTLQNIASEHGLTILRETVGTQVSPALVLAVIAIESAGRRDAVSSAGATGLMQLMPATAERFGVADSMIAADNIKGGVAYLGWLLDHFEDDAVLALAGYNAGEGNVRRYEGVPPFAETRDYVPKVLAAWQVAKGLCVTPPELISDPCVFNVNGI